jgi:CTP:molybdopterin cytidylyltransferase MocA
MLAAVILTGGESRRMGSPKALLPYHGRTFIEHLLEVTEHPRVGIRRIVTGANHAEIVRRLPLPADIVVMNRSWQRGQLSSIRAAIESLRAVETEGMMLTLVDHPLITKAVVESLIAAFDRSPRSIVLPTWQGRRGHPVIFPARLYSELYHAPDDVGARAVVWAHKNEVIEVPCEEEGVVLDIDDRATFDQLFPST